MSTTYGVNNEKENAETAKTALEALSKAVEESGQPSRKAKKATETGDVLISVCLIVSEKHKDKLEKFMKHCLRGPEVELIVMESKRVSHENYNEYMKANNVPRQEGTDKYYITKKLQDGPVSYYNYYYVSDYTELLPSFKFIRNEIKNLARGKWIFSIDIDEILPPYLHKEFIETVRALPDNIDGIIIPTASHVYDYADNQRSYINTTSIRLFRNIDSIVWQPNMHEMVNFSIPDERIMYSDIQLIHSGYSLSPQGFKDKLLHRIKILGRDIYELPEGHQFNRALIYLANNIEKYNKLIQGD